MSYECDYFLLLLFNVYISLALLHDFSTIENKNKGKNAFKLIKGHAFRQTQ